MRTSFYSLLFVLPLTHAVSARAEPSELAPPPPDSAPASTPSAPLPEVNATAAPQPPAVTTPAPAVSAPVPPPRYTAAPHAPALSAPVWRIRDARLILNAKNLGTLGVSWSASKSVGSSSTYRDRDYSFGFLVGARPSIDVVFGSALLWTAGAEVNFYGHGGKSLPDGTSSSARSAWLLPRGGVILGDAEDFGIWLRAGVGYSIGSFMNDNPNSTASSSSSSAVLVLVDPVLMFSPVPRAAITFGPDFMVRSGTSKLEGVKSSTDTSVSIGIQFGISLLL